MRVFLARSQETTHPQPLPGGEDRRQEVRGKMWGEIIQKIQHFFFIFFLKIDAIKDLTTIII
ncbi:MAG: hypothetical protein F6K18_26190 [Okeania sp. SIO2C2]|uniref:hypothetical protein n=1 Tax=Okeania sp. SIO2C2 TaxID=2607787 RepID=UPI0013BA5014|nr:hypothetical protein [Okeania sp. SIO2C2]NEP90031.1 hypothetical protein [Okeania sp. SIO2C2]